MIIGFTTGTFDILHYGHIRLLQKAKSKCDYLIVGLNVNPVGKTPYFSYKIRKCILESLKFVDEVVAINKPADVEKWLKEKSVNIFFMGDYKGDGLITPTDIKKKYCKIIKIKRTKGISTSKIKTDLI